KVFLFLFSLKKKKGLRVFQVVVFHLIRHICRKGFSVADHVTKLVWYNVLYQNRIWLSSCDMLNVRNGGGLSMAHVQKFSRGAVGGLSSHIERKTKNHSNKDIDTERTHENYDLCEKDGDMISRYKERLDEVHCLNRKDVKVMADWVVTLPE